jgi:hypothetical protein
MSFMSTLLSCIHPREKDVSSEKIGYGGKAKKRDTLVGLERPTDLDADAG